MIVCEKNVINNFINYRKIKKDIKNKFIKSLDKREIVENCLPEDRKLKLNKDNVGLDYIKLNFNKKIKDKINKNPMIIYDLVLPIINNIISDICPEYTVLDDKDKLEVFDINLEKNYILISI